MSTVRQAASRVFRCSVLLLLLHMHLAGCGPLPEPSTTRIVTVDTANVNEMGRAIAAMQLDETSLPGLQLHLDQVRRWSAAGPRKSPLLQEGLGSDVSVLVLHLWGSYCGECRREMPIFNRLFPASEKAPTSAFFSICVDQCDDDSIERFLKQLDQGSPATHAVYTGMALVEQLPKVSLPMTLLVSRSDGTIRQAFVGPVTARGNELFDSVDQLKTTFDLTTHLPRLCSEPPCIKNTFLLHKRLRTRALSVWQQAARRWQSSEQLFKPAPTPVLVYLFSGDGQASQADLIRLQDISRNWAHLRSPAPRLAVLAIGGDPKQLEELIARLGLSFPYGTIAATDDPELKDLWLRVGQPATLLLDPQRIIRHAFLGSYETQRRKVDSAIERMLAHRSSTSHRL